MRQRIFKQHIALYYMLELRKAGATYEQLAELFNCHFTTIQYHCQKYGLDYDYRNGNNTLITPNIIYIFTGKQTILNEPKEETWYVVNNEKVNKGKTYQEYLQDYLNYHGS